MSQFEGATSHAKTEIFGAAFRGVGDLTLTLGFLPVQTGSPTAGASLRHGARRVRFFTAGLSRRVC